MGRGRNNERWMKLTHLPTGLAATCRNSDSRGWHRVRLWTEGMLRAKLFMQRQDPDWREGCYPGREIVRSYHLSPRAGTSPYVCDQRSGVTASVELDDLFGCGRWDWILKAPTTERSIERLILSRRKAISP